MTPPRELRSLPPEGMRQPSGGRQLDARPCYEHCGPGSGFDAKTGVVAGELRIPVAPL